MIRFSQLRGQRVLARQDARLVGSVRRLLLDPAQPSVTAAELDGVEGEETILPWKAVVSVGPDALMVESAHILEAPAGELQEKLRRGVFDLEGKLVLTDMGDAMGRLEDVEFDESNGQLIQLKVPGHNLPLERFIAIGPDALIVPAAP